VRASLQVRRTLHSIFGNMLLSLVRPEAVKSVQPWALLAPDNIFSIPICAAELFHIVEKPRQDLWHWRLFSSSVIKSRFCMIAPIHILRSPIVSLYSCRTSKADKYGCLSISVNRNEANQCSIQGWNEAPETWVSPVAASFQWLKEIWLVFILANSSQIVAMKIYNHHTRASMLLESSPQNGIPQNPR